MYILWTLAIALSAMAHTSNKSDTGLELYWPSRSLSIRVANGSKSLTGTQTNNILQSSSAQWNSGSSAQININNGSVNNLRYAQNSDIFGPGVVGVTQINYGKNGVISQADIILNEANYTFTTNPSDTLGSIVYLGDVLTHELGHFVGLSHSEVLESSMFYSSARGQSTVSQDDLSGIRAKYDGSSQIIKGRVAGGRNIGVFGAHVIAFSAIDGSVQSSTITSETGAFTLTGLLADKTYYLYVTTLKNGTAIDPTYSSVQNNFCPGSFVGSFFQGCSEHDKGIPQPIHLSYGETEDVGNISVKCSTTVPVDYYAGKLSNPKTSYDFFSTSSTHQKSMVGIVTVSEVPLSTYQKVDEIDLDYRDLSLTGLSSSPFVHLGLNATQIGSPIDTYMIVTRSDGVETFLPRRPELSYVKNLVNPDNLPVIDSLTGVPVYDYQKKVSLSLTPATNRFKIEIYARKIPQYSINYLLAFPVTEGFLSTKDWAYLLTTSIGSNSGYLIEDVASQDNTSCLDAPFTYAVKKSKSASASTASSSKDDGAGASCGTIATTPEDGEGPGGMTMSLLTGFALSLLASILQKSRKYFLS